MPRDGRGGRVEEGVDSRGVGRVAGRDLGGHRIAERQLDRAGLHVGGGDGARVAGAAGLGEMGDDVRLAERAHRLQRHQLGVAGPDADPDQPRRPCSRPLLPGERVDRGGGDGAAAEPAAHGDERHAAPRRSARPSIRRRRRSRRECRRSPPGAARRRGAFRGGGRGRSAHCRWRRPRRRGGHARGRGRRPSGWCRGARRDRRRAGRGGCRSRRCRPEAARG